jgi:HK97 family phage prohead protease
MLPIKIVKQYSTVLKAVDKTERTITILASTGEKDRSGEFIPPEEWKLTNYEKNPVILWAHNYDQPAVAKALWSKADKTGLIQKIQFAKTAFASELFELYSEGFMSAFSVGFMSNRDDQDSNILRNCELLEVSCVPVPCNANALMARAASGLIKSPEALAFVKSLEKPEQTSKAADSAFTDGLMKELENMKHENEHLVEQINAYVKASQVKEGRVLSTKNRELISTAVSALQALLDTTEPTQDALPVTQTRGLKIKLGTKEDAPKDPETLAEKVAVAIKQVNIPQLIDREVRKMKGEVV